MPRRDPARMSFRDAYLKRLGVAEPGPPGAAALRALHTAHVERVAYEALDIQLGRLTSIDPVDSVERVVAGARRLLLPPQRGLLTAAARPRVRRQLAPRRSAEPTAPAARRGLGQPPGPHRTRAGAASAGLAGRCRSRRRAARAAAAERGEYAQGPFRYRLRPSETEPDGWRFDHDPRGAFAGMDFAAAARRSPTSRSGTTTCRPRRTPPSSVRARSSAVTRAASTSSPAAC